MSLVRRRSLRAPAARMALLPAAALLLTVIAGPAAAAGAVAPVPRPVVGLVDGRTGPQLLADSFVANYVGPAQDPATCPRLGRHDRVVWVTGDQALCTMRPGDSAVALPGAACSDVEQPPFLAVGEAAQRACARDVNAGIASLTVAVDGARAVRITRPAFAVSAPQRRVVIRAGNPGGFRAGPATFTAEGWAAELRPLTPGTHTVHVELRLVDVPEPLVADVTLVMSRR